MQLAQETATVSYIKDDFAYLQTGGASACSKCSAQSSCSNFSFIKPAKSLLKIKNTLHLKAGDSVVIAVPASKLLLGAVIMYIFPLLSLFLFALVGKSLGGEVVSVAAGILGLVGGVLLVKVIVRHPGLSQKFEPKAVRKVVAINVETPLA